jgi:SAM-dependent methyltransferase
MSEKQRSFPDWNLLYKNENVVNMPWYSKDLDPDLKEEIIRRIRVTANNTTSSKFLDLGTGPGTQALHLAELGFDVTASDLSEYAIKKAKHLSNKINFIVDDILNSSLKENEFEYVFDRGCFHVISINNRERYVAIIKSILKDGGILFLKCFNEKELREIGPYRFSSSKINEIFGKHFEILSIKNTVYQGTLNPLPKALFIVMKKRKTIENDKDM